MRRIFVIVAVLAALGALSVDAQQPALQIYFDAALTQCVLDCQGFSLDTLYVVARNVNALVADIAYKIDYGSGSWLDDIVSPLYTTVGVSLFGIEIQYPTPIDFGGWIVVQRAYVLWNCDCNNPEPPVSPLPHPTYGELRVTEYPSLTTTALQPLIGLVCVTGIPTCEGGAVPTEYSSWGRIKALFESNRN